MRQPQPPQPSASSTENPYADDGVEVQDVQEEVGEDDILILDEDANFAPVVSTKEEPIDEKEEEDPLVAAAVKLAKEVSANAAVPWGVCGGGVCVSVE